jgi:hypothetical protein
LLTLDIVDTATYTLKIQVLLQVIVRNVVRLRTLSLTIVNSGQNIFKNHRLTPVILDTWETEIRRITVQAQPDK